MKKIIVSAMAIVVIAGVAFTSTQAVGLPSSKAAVSMGKLIDLGAVASTTGAPLSDTGYITVMNALIKTSEMKDLSADVSLQCGLLTETVVRSKNGTVDISQAQGAISVRVKGTNQATGQVRYFEPSEEGTAPDGNPQGVTYCSRLQKLEAQFAGLNCTTDLLTGIVTCADDEKLGLLLKSLNANSFNFLLSDVNSGVWKIEVQARANSSVQLAGSGLGSAAAEAFVGLGSTRIESLRLIKDANVSAELQ